MTKTAEIVQKLQAGMTAKELIKEGYSHGLVYAANKKYKKAVLAPVEKYNANPIANSSHIPEGTIEDPEIVQLKKDIQWAELKRKLDETAVPAEMWPVIAEYECRIDRLERGMKQQAVVITELRDIITKPPISDLLQKNQCTCGTKAVLALKLYCTDCGKEYWCRQ